MKFMVLGGGGREHAIVHAFSKSKIVTELHCCPGNPGIAELALCHNADVCAPLEITALCKRLEIDFVFVGPEAPLVAGTADALRNIGIPVMGPGMSGARLEGSKAFSKQFMKRHNIPTSDFDCCTDMESCRKAIAKRKAPYVVKADGLAAGKGAFILDSAEEALNICSMMLEDVSLGEAGKTVVVEDFINGEEMTVLALTDGETVRVLPSSQDHKRALDGDKGNNTGGMGAFSPLEWVSESFMDRVMTEVLIPTVKGLASDGIPFCGVIYAGLMITEDGNISVLEYNVRLGDPEAQVVLPVFGGDFAEVSLACANGRLSQISWPKPCGVALGVVMASGGYPESFKTGYEITGIKTEIPNTFVYHAGTKKNEANALVTSGGRVLTVVGISDTLQEAKNLAYSRVNAINFEKEHHRNDIGDKTLKGHKDFPVPSRIGIIMGSASDAGLVAKGVSVLNELGIEYETAIASAHRTPLDAENYAKNAKKRGIEVIIAVAGLSAALPGVIAASTTLPVIGVPVKGGAIDGLDALLSIAQMPPGVPVASVGLDGIKNACLLAVRILGIHDKTVSQKLEEWIKAEAQKVKDSRAKLEGINPAPQSAYEI